MVGFISNSTEFSIDNKKIPYYGIKLTPEQAKEIEGKKPELGSIDGKNIFQVRDKDGKDTGERYIFILFLEPSEMWRIL